MQRVSQSVDQVFGWLKVRANRHGDHLSTLLGGRYPPGPPLLSRPYISSVLYPSGERHDGPQAIAAASSCHVPVCQERDANPDVPTWNCPQLNRPVD